jgi:hypothetical protein
VPDGDDVQVRWREIGAAEDSVMVRQGRKP